MADERPNPLKEVANKVGVAWAVTSGLVSAGVTYGLLTAAQGQALDAAGDALSPTILALGTVIGGVLPLISGIIAAFKTASVGKDHVTPLVSPMDNDGNKLAPVVPNKHIGPLRNS